MGLTHNMPKTAALPALYFGRVKRSEVVDAIKAIATLQRDNGDRKDRRQARWKYTVRRLGVDSSEAGAARQRFGIDLEDAEPGPLPPMDLHLGWHEQRGGKGYYGISVENGRLDAATRKGIRAAVDAFDLAVRLTPQQDLLLCDVARPRRTREAARRIRRARPGDGFARCAPTRWPVPPSPPVAWP